MRIRKRYIVLLIIATVIAAVGAVVLLLLALNLKPWVQDKITQAGREHGVELTVGEIDVGWGWVRLVDCKATLVGVRGFEARLERATVDLDRFTPTRLEVRGMNLSLVGTASDLALDLSTWSKDHPLALRFPIIAQGVHVKWSEREGGPPLLVLDEGLMAPRGEGGSLRAPKAVADGVPLGAVGAVWNADRTQVSLGFGTDDLQTAPLRVDVRLDETPAVARMKLKPVKLSQIGLPLGVNLAGHDDVEVDASAEVQLKADEVDGSFPGHAQITLKGYVPPHPPELGGIVFGDQTTFQSKFRIAADRKQVKLSGATVTAGAFKLSGDGTIDREPTHALIHMKLKGAIPCTALAKSAAVARLGSQFGGLVGEAAKKALTGYVQVAVELNADTRDLDAAEVKQSAGIGCKIKLPTLKDLRDLTDLLPKLPELPTDRPTRPTPTP